MTMGPPPPPREGGRVPPPVNLRLWGDYIFVFFAVGLSVAMKATSRWYKDSINLEKIKASQLEADLRNLRNQLNPHFLFNTLNNIYSLIAVDTKKAQESVHMLSSLLRYTLYDNNKKFVNINEDLEFTRSYIDLMKLRLNHKVKLNIFINNNDNNGEIAPLMFITLIENAFKHGISNEKDSFISIKILVEKGEGVLCTVENSLNENNNIQNMEIKNSGIGLANLSQRLELLYPHNHEFIVEKRENSFFTLLRINFTTTNLKEKNEIEMYNY